jgi:AraC-like DNA-binding protein
LTPRALRDSESSLFPAAARQAEAVPKLRPPHLRLGTNSAHYEGPLLGVGRHASGVTCIVEATPGVSVIIKGKRHRGRVVIPAGVMHEVTGPPGASVTFSYVEPDAHDAVDPRLRRCVVALRADPSVTTASLARAVELSESRLRHLALEQFGVPLVRVRWWLQMRVVAKSLSRGFTLTEAAHDAGFSDSAHFTRTFRRMFGFAPSTLLAAGVRLVVD